MAYDKVVDSSVLDAGLKQIADAIREKGGTSDNLAFPQAMADAIAAIEAGGGGGGDIAYGTVTPASNASAVVTHDLGVIPTKGIFVNTSATVTSTSDMVALYQHATEPGARVYSYNSAISASGIPNGRKLTQTTGTYYFHKASESTVNTPNTIVAGNTYFWAVMK